MSGIEPKILVNPIGDLAVTTREVHPIDHNDGCGVTELIGESAFVQLSPIRMPEDEPPPEMIIRGPDIIKTTRW